MKVTILILMSFIINIIKLNVMVMISNDESKSVPGNRNNILNQVFPCILTVDVHLIYYVDIHIVFSILYYIC